jgi:hypothetical protein
MIAGTGTSVESRAHFLPFDGALGTGVKTAS